jgi:hypothetical protein
MIIVEGIMVLEEVTTDLPEVMGSRLMAQIASTIPLPINLQNGQAILPITHSNKA